LTPLLAQWRSLTTRMTRKDVRHTLGEPLRLQRTENSEQWVYVYEAIAGKTSTVEGMVKFDPDDGRVLSWNEPDWQTLNQPSTAK
jgi:outer membrane protein assembly factor BamE (lipoprotein component of BamABCDE complex)